jgi:hypothetical protein
VTLRRPMTPMRSPSVPPVRSTAAPASSMAPTAPPTRSGARLDQEAAVLLRRAAYVLREYGWCQREIARYADGHPVWAIRALLSEGETVTRWNDTPGRTADEVIAVLEAAAERLDPTPVGVVGGGPLPELVAR